MTRKEEAKMKKLIVIVIAIAIIAMAGVAMAGDTATVSVSASVSGTCKFNSGTKTVSYTLDPATGGNVSGTVSQPTFWCTKGSTYTITDDNGSNKSGTTYRMKHASLAEYIPYSFTYTDSGTGQGKSTAITMDIASTVAEAAYINASAGNYSDSVLLTIAP